MTALPWPRPRPPARAADPVVFGDVPGGSQRLDILRDWPASGCAACGVLWSGDTACWCCGVRA